MEVLSRLTLVSTLRCLRQTLLTRGGGINVTNGNAPQFGEPEAPFRRCPRTGVSIVTGKKRRWQSGDTTKHSRHVGALWRFPLDPSHGPTAEASEWLRITTS